MPDVLTEEEKGNAIPCPCGQPPKHPMLWIRYDQGPYKGMVGWVHQGCGEVEDA